MGCADSKATSTDSKNKSAGDEDVYVTVEEAENYVKQELGVNDEKAKKIVASTNKNDDGKVSNKELTALWKKIQVKKEEIKAQFAAVDTDNSGYITTEESMQILKSLFKDVDETKMKALIARFDENKDGKIKYGEFVIFYAHISAKREELGAAVNALHKDENGAISADDIVTLISGHCGLDDCYTRSLVEDFDQNKDGKINTAEFDGLLSSLFP